MQPRASRRSRRRRSARLGFRRSRERFRRSSRWRTGRGDRFSKRGLGRKGGGAQATYRPSTGQDALCPPSLDGRSEVMSFDPAPPNSGCSPSGEGSLGRGPPAPQTKGLERDTNRNWDPRSSPVSPTASRLTSFMGGAVPELRGRARTGAAARRSLASSVRSRPELRGRARAPTCSTTSRWSGSSARRRSCGTKLELRHARRGWLGVGGRQGLVQQRSDRVRQRPSPSPCLVFHPAVEIVRHGDLHRLHRLPFGWSVGDPSLMSAHK